MKKIVGLLCLALSLSAAPHLLAKPPNAKSGSGKKSSPVQPIPTNESRAVDASELFTDVTGVPPPTVFQTADRDADGSVSFDEFETTVDESVSRRVAKRFSQLDRNRDGRCSRSEVNKMSASRFARFDANGDGVFTPAELGALMKGLVAGRLAQVYARLDVDRDGRVSVAELSPRPKRAVVAAQKSTDVARSGAASVH